MKYSIILALFFLPFISRTEIPYTSCTLFDPIIEEYNDFKGETPAISAFISELIGMVSKSEQNFNYVLNTEATASAKAKARNFLEKTAATKTRLNQLLKQSKNITGRDAYRSMLSEALKVSSEWSQNDPGFIAIAPPGGGLVTIIPNPPINSCFGAGDDVKEDCLGALDTMEQCGAISPADKVMGKLTSQMAGKTEENNCNIKNSMGQQYVPVETNMREEAMGACEQVENQKQKKGNYQKGQGNIF